MPTDKQQLSAAPATPAAVTPGQKLLLSLHQTSSGRLQRYQKTVAAQADKAKQSIPQPKPPGSNEVGNTPVEEVHQLPADAPSTRGNMQGILAMLHRKAERHGAALERYQAAKHSAEQEHNAAAAAAAAHSKSQLEGISSSIDATMSVLAADRVMVLDEQQLQEVWASIEARRADITKCVQALAAGLRSAEEVFKQSVQAALQEMVADMCDIAHIDEGRVQRLTEQETAALNQTLLDNRQAVADVLQQLHAGEVLQEQARFKAYKRSCEAWRMLRSRHAIECFCQHVRQDLAEPPKRLELFAHLRDAQQAAHGQLQKLCSQLQQLVPPHLTAGSVAAWVGQAKQWSAGWQQLLDKHLQELQLHEQEVERQVHEGCAVLRSEVLSYKGLAEGQVDELLTHQVQPVLDSRREAAHQLLQCTETYLQRQAGEWQLAVQVLSSWLSSLVSLFESHKASTAAAESGIKAQLRAAVERFQAEDSARELALRAAAESLSQSSDEKELDARLGDTLQVLTAIQHGYRAHATSSVAAVRAYPGQVKGRASMYIKCLCGLLHVQPQPPAMDAVGGAGQAAGQDAGQTVAACGLCLEPIRVPPGGAYSYLHDLWQALLDATPKPWLEKFQHQQQPADLAGAPDAQGATATATPPAPAPAPKAAPAGKMTKQQQAEAAAAEEAAHAAAEAAVAAAAAEAAAYAAAAAPPPCPADSQGGMLCLDLATPEASIREGLHNLQVSMLQEGESFAGRCQGSAECWAEQMEVLLTEELDRRLRAHRPRAGKLEEEVRVARSTELVAQRRRVDAHLKAQEKAVQQQAAHVSAAVLALRTDAAAWCAKLLDYERLLGNALSSKGIDICWREAQALRVKLDKQLEQRLQQLQVLIYDTCSSLSATSTAFEAEHLRSFADGGRYAEASLKSHRSHLAALHAYVSQQQGAQQAQRAALQTELTNSLQQAQDAVQQLLPSHKQDMVLVELLAQQVEGARKAAVAALSSNTEAADDIDTLLAHLRGGLEKAASTWAVARQVEPGVALKGVDAHATCQHLLTTVNSLRQLLLRQSQVLELLQSSGVPDGPVALSLPSDPQPVPPQGNPTPVGERPAPLLTSRATTPQTGKAGSQAASGAKPAAKGPGQRAGSAVGKANQATAAASAAAAAAALAATGSSAVVTPEAPAVPLAKHINGIIDASKQEVEVAAKAYYAAKEPARPIRYPAKIAATQQVLLASVDDILSGLRQMLQEHMAGGTKRLRVQVVQGYRLLEKVPSAALSLLTHHLLSVSADQRQHLLGGFIAQRRLLEQRLEQHKRTLHPSMLHVAKRAELEALKAAEVNRRQEAAALTSCCASTCLSLTHSHVQHILAAAIELSRLLLVLFDGFVLPADLVSLPEGDDALCGLERLSLEELQRLAAVQDAAQPLTGPAASAMPSKGAGSGKGAKPGSVNGDAVAAPVFAAAAAVGTGVSATASGRPFSCVSWELDDDKVSLASLGWTDADQAALVAPPPQPAPPAVATAATGVSAGPPKPANTAPAKAPAQVAPPTEAVLVQGLDTVCHRAVVLAHRAAVQLAQAHLSQEAVGCLKVMLHAWCNHEDQWACAWEAMLQDLDTV